MEFCIKKYCIKSLSDVDLSFLAPMARRKLSELDKIALCIMNECLSCAEDKNIKIVFASQYGEVGRLKKLVGQYSEENEVSPATFSASVHNSAVGQFSLINKITKSYNSISAEEFTFEAGLIEAILSAKNEEVLFCFCDSDLSQNARGFGCIISPCGQNNAVLKDGRLYCKINGVRECIF